MISLVPRGIFVWGLVWLVEFGCLVCWFTFNFKQVWHLKLFSPLSQEDPLEEEMATHSSILAWEIPWTEDPGGLQFTGWQRIRHNWTHRHDWAQTHTTHTHTHTHTRTPGKKNKSRNKEITIRKESEDSECHKHTGRGMRRTSFRFPAGKNLIGLLPCMRST